MLTFAFFLGTAALFLQLGGIGLLPCAPYIPWIAYVLLRCPLHKALWLSAAAGVIVDLFSDHPIGLHPISYAVSAACAYRLAKRFLADAPLHLALYSALISFLSTLFHLFLLFLFDRRIPFAGKWVFGEPVGLALVDGIYALVWFALPLALALALKRHWTVFWLKRKHSSIATHSSP